MVISIDRLVVEQDMIPGLTVYKIYHVRQYVALHITGIFQN